MAITAQQIQAAEVVQRAAAHDGAPQVRLVAGPGTGKSFSIEERVCWLLGRLLYVSITRARAACVLSRATRRRVQARIQAVAASRFTTSLNGPFFKRAVGLQPAEVQQVMADVGNLWFSSRQCYL